MKNKKLLYILIPLTILLWGSIVFKIFNSYFGDDEIANQTPNSFSENNDQLVLADTFSIANNYPDPFLGKISPKTPSNSNGTTSFQNSKTQKKPLISSVWPDIAYKGVIKNQKSSKQLALVEINGQGNAMKVGESINNIVLTRVFKDSIEVKLGSEKKFVKKIF